MLTIKSIWCCMLPLVGLNAVHTVLLLQDLCDVRLEVAFGSDPLLLVVEATTPGLGMCDHSVRQVLEGILWQTHLFHKHYICHCV